MRSNSKDGDSRRTPDTSKRVLSEMALVLATPRRMITGSKGQGGLLDSPIKARHEVIVVERRVAVDEDVRINSDQV